jgi:hypothetical protein
MEENRKKVLGTVSAAALAAGLGGAAMAAVPTDQAAQAPAARQAADATVRAGDPFVELMLRSGGTLTADSVAGTLRAMYPQLSEAQALELPALIRSLRNLGLGSAVETAATDTLLDLLAGAGLTLDDRRLEELAAALTAEPAEYRLAKVQDNPGTGRASDTGKANASPTGLSHGNGLGGYQP